MNFERKECNRIENAQVFETLVIFTHLLGMIIKFSQRTEVKINLLQRKSNSFIHPKQKHQLDNFV